MAGLDPAIHAPTADVDTRVKPGYDGLRKVTKFFF